jgi:hypothetical protein
MISLALILSLNTNLPMNKSFLITTIFVIVVILVPYISKGFFSHDTIGSKFLSFVKIVLSGFRARFSHRKINEVLFTQKTKRINDPRMKS